MKAEEFAFKTLEAFNDHVDSLIEDHITDLEKEEVVSKPVVKPKVVTSTVPDSTEEVVKEDKVVEHVINHDGITTHDEDGNPVIIGHCRKYLIRITTPEGIEYLYGSAVIAQDYLGVTDATIRTRCRKGDFVDESGNVWEEVSLADYKAENGINE